MDLDHGRVSTHGWLSRAGGVGPALDRLHGFLKRSCDVDRPFHRAPCRGIARHPVIVPRILPQIRGRLFSDLAASSSARRSHGRALVGDAGTVSLGLAACWMTTI